MAIGLCLRTLGGDSGKAVFFEPKNVVAEALRLFSEVIRVEALTSLLKTGGLDGLDTPSPCGYIIQPSRHDP